MIVENAKRSLITWNFNNKVLGFRRLGVPLRVRCYQGLNVFRVLGLGFRVVEGLGRV